MKIRQLAVPGAWEVTPDLHGDGRGMFLEMYRADRIAAAAGAPLDLVQANLSVSRAGVVRGIHFTAVPPGQVKYVTCVRGAVRDVVVDIRVGSPTFGRWDAVRLDDETRRAVYVSDGLGHGYCALTDDATMLYLCSAGYRPDRERAVHPLDPDLGIDWPATDPVLSERDRAAPTLKELDERGLLPDYAAARRGDGAR